LASGDTPSGGYCAVAWSLNYGVSWGGCGKTKGDARAWALKECENQIFLHYRVNTGHNCVIVHTSSGK
jgi:hypothetical protein